MDDDALRRRSEWDEMDDDALRRLVLSQPVPHRLIRAIGRPCRDARPVTARELDVVRCYSHGMTARMAADALGIAYATVRNHAASAQAKLKAKNATHMVAEALRQNLID